METHLCKTIWIMQFQLLSCRLHQARNMMIWGSLKENFISPSFSVALRDDVPGGTGCNLAGTSTFSWEAELRNICLYLTYEPCDSWSHSTTQELFEGHTHLISQWNFVSCVLLELALSFHSYLPSVHFWGWDWCWQSLGCWVGAVTWLCDKEATSPLYFTLWLWLQNQFRSNFSHYSCIIVLGFCLPSHQK